MQNKILATILFAIFIASSNVQADQTYINTPDLTSTRAKRNYDKERIRRSYKKKGPSQKISRKNSPSTDSGYTKASIAYPTGKISTSSLLIEKMYPSVVRLGKPYEYKIKATNLTELNLQNVSISELIPEGFELVRAEPAVTSQSGDTANWDLGTLDPNESVLITVRGKASNQNQLPCCTSADYANPALCSKSQVVSPAITLALQAPEEVTICQRIPLEYTVKNTGDSTLENVQVEAELPGGIRNLTGGKSITLKTGNLAAGESKLLRVYARAEKTGSYKFKGQAISNHASASSGLKTTRVVQPTIAVTAQVDREKVYIGRPLTYTFKIKNTGDTASDLTLLKANISSSARVKSASNDGRISGNNVSWNMGTLKPGASRSVEVMAIGSAPGSTRAEAIGNATCAETTADTAQSLVSGIPALLLEVVDIVDPIEINGEETYIITVTNQGSADANNIQIKAMLEGMKYVSADGATRGQMSGNTLSFNSLPTLSPKQKAQWNINVSGQKTGDLRFKVSLDSDELTRSVEETESTYVY